MHLWIWTINIHIYTCVHKYTHVGRLNFEIIYDTLYIYICKLYSFHLFFSFISFKRWLIVLVLEINPGPCAYQVWAPPWSFGPRFISPSFFLSVGKNSLSGVIVALPVRLHSDKASSFSSCKAAHSQNATWCSFILLWYLECLIFLRKSDRIFSEMCLCQ